MPVAGRQRVGLPTTSATSPFPPRTEPSFPAAQSATEDLVSKPRSHQLDVYGAWFHLVTDGRGWAIMRRQLPSLGERPDAQGAVCLTLHTLPKGKTIPHVTVYLQVDSCEEQRDLVDLVAHESIHAAASLLDHFGERYDGNSEALAYLTGWVAGWLWDSLHDG